MNTLPTLFGGLLAVLVLYAVGGSVRGLPPMLRAVLAGVIPLLAYFILIIGRWPGLDVVAIHISVFLATALVAHVLSQFRRRGNRLHWAPRILIVFFIGLAILNATLLYVATSGLPEPLARWWLGGEGRVYSGFSGVVAHDQAAAKAVSSELSEAHREALLGWHVEIEGLADGDANTVLPVLIRVRERTGLPVGDLRAVLDLARPGATKSEQQFVLAQAEPGVYQGAVQLPGAGRWLLEVRLLKGNAVGYHGTREVRVR